MVGVIGVANGDGAGGVDGRREKWMCGKGRR